MSPIDGKRPAAALNAWQAYHRPAGVRGAGWLFVLAAHAALLALWWTARTQVQVPPRVVWMQWVPVQPDPPPTPVPTPVPTPPTPRPTPRSAPKTPVVPPVLAPAAPAVVATPAPPPGPRHAESSEWITPEAAAPSGPGARRAPSDYAEAVKSQVIAKVVYPAKAVYPAPKGFKGDPRELLRQCTIPYEVVVDRQGQIVSYEIERCGDDLLDAAAEGAVLKAQPFPPPPEGAEQYRIYGSINFMKPRLDGPAADSRP